MEDFVDGIDNIVEAQKKMALNYFEDGSVESAIPPLKILLHIMAYGEYKGKDICDPELRKYFERDYVINSDWYKERLILKQQKDIEFYTNRVKYLNDFIKNPGNAVLLDEMNISERLKQAQDMLEHVESAEYLKELEGTIGLDPLFRKTSKKEAEQFADVLMN